VNKILLLIEDFSWRVKPPKVAADGAGCFQGSRPQDAFTSDFKSPRHSLGPIRLVSAACRETRL